MPNKNFITICLVMVAIMAVLFFGTRDIALQSLDKLGQQEMLRNVERATNALDTEIQQLSTTAGDYAAWDDAYAFVKDHNQEFITNSLGESFYAKLRFNLFLYCDLSGAIVHGKAIDYRNSWTQPIPQPILDQLKPGSLLLTHNSPESIANGFLELPEGLMAIVSRPVLTSEYQGPPAGTLIIGRYLDSPELKKLSDRTRLPMQITLTSEVKRRAELQQVKRQISWDGQNVVQPAGENTLVGSALIKDIFGNDVALLQVTLPRYIYQEGKKAFAQFLMLYGATAFFFIIVFTTLGVKLFYTRHLERQAQEQLAYSEQRYRTVSLLSSDFAYSCLPQADGRYQVDWITDAFFSITGFTRQELAARGCWLFCAHAEDSSVVRDQLNALTLGTRSEAEFRLRAKDGSLRWLSNVMELQADPKAPQGRRLIGAARDITTRKLSEEQIARSLKEKEVLLKEVHHRVKNNMQIIYSLLNLQACGLADASIRAMFEESKNRISAMAMIHDKLYRSTDLASIDFKEYLLSLMHGIADSFNRPDILTAVDMEPLSLDVSIGIPCGLIVNELVSNCFKYAFPGGRRGIITIGIKRDPQGSHVLTVADNGIGFPPGVDFRNSTSLGLQLVMVLCGQLNGTIALLSTAEGSRFNITFPVPDPNRPGERNE